jgi:cytochrome c oxidase subunit 4
MTKSTTRPGLLPIVATYIALMGLLGMSLAVALSPVGAFKPLLATLIAELKAGLVLVVFMRLKWSSNRVRMAAATGYVWLAILLILTLAEVLSR